MITNFNPLAVVWGVFALLTVVLMVYRWHMATREDDSIHLSGGESANQLFLAKRLAAVDKWGKSVTAVTLVYGLGLLVLYFYAVWKDVPTY